MDDDTILVKYQFKAPAPGAVAGCFGLGARVFCYGWCLYFFFFAVLSLASADFKGGLLCLFMVAIPVVVIVSNRRERQSKKQYREVMGDQPVSWRITPQMLSGELGGNGALLRCDFAWERIERIGEYTNGFAISATIWEEPWLPFDGFEDAGKLEKFRQMAQAAGVRISKKVGHMTTEHRDNL